MNGKVSERVVLKEGGSWSWVYSRRQVKETVSVKMVLKVGRFMVIGSFT